MKELYIYFFSIIIHFDRIGNMVCLKIFSKFRERHYSLDNDDFFEGLQYHLLLKFVIKKTIPTFINFTV